MNLFDWIIVGIGAVAALIVVGLSFHTGHHEWLRAQFAYRSGLTLPADLEPAISRRLALRERVGAIGAFVGLAVGTLAAPALYGDDSNSSVLFVIGGAAAGLAVAVAVTSAFFVGATHTGEVVYARSKQVTLADYSAGLERTLARVAVALAVLSLPALAIAGIPVTTNPEFALVIAAVVSLALFEIRGRQIIAQGQRAASPNELAVDDALRAKEIADLVGPPLLFGVYGFTFSVVHIISALSGLPFDAVIDPALLVIYALVLIYVFVTNRTAPRQHYLRRLWSSEAPTLRTDAVDQH